VETDAAVDRVTRGLSHRDVPQDASPRGTGSSAASMGGAIEEVEADAAAD
jgi:hypothetical protein